MVKVCLQRYWRNPSLFFTKTMTHLNSLKKLLRGRNPKNVKVNKTYNDNERYAKLLQNNLEISCQSVSYTHLDVYKRQPQ